MAGGGTGVGTDGARFETDLVAVLAGRRCVVTGLAAAMESTSKESGDLEISGCRGSAERMGTHFPQAVPHETRFGSCEQRTFPTRRLVQAQDFSIRKGHGGQSSVSWQAWGI